MEDNKAKSVDQLTGPAPSVKTRTQADIDSEASLVRLELEKGKLEMQGLELEQLKHNIMLIRATKEQQRMSTAAVQDSLAEERETRIVKETLCTHMKGGNADEMLRGAPAQGGDQLNYAMWTHSLTTGVTFRICSRCGKTWFPGDPDYKWAMSRPSRNSPSTGCPSPGLIKNQSQVRRVSEVPHRAKPVLDYEEL